LSVLSPDGLLVCVEAGGDGAFAICRKLHGMRLAGFFDRANAVLVGRTNAPDAGSLSQHEAVLDALGSLNVPIITDVECGHVPPSSPSSTGPSAAPSSSACTPTSKVWSGAAYPEAAGVSSRARSRGYRPATSSALAMVSRSSTSLRWR
jgi:hypothetical protein